MVVDKRLADEPMPNYGSVNYLKFWADWTLESRPRRPALLIDDAQEEYREYAGGIIPNLEQLVQVFRETDQPIVWSSWSRTYQDGCLNAMDQWYGPRGITDKKNALYIYKDGGLDPLKEIAPTPDELEKANRMFYHSKHLDMFWSFDESGKSILDEMLKSLAVDTVVITGLWTDECIVATAYAALSRGYDVVVVGDAVATATAHHQAALTVMNATCGKVIETNDVIPYMKNKLQLCEPGAYKGTNSPDGRKD